MCDICDDSDVGDKLECQQERFPAVETTSTNTSSQLVVNQLVDIYQTILSRLIHVIMPPSTADRQHAAAQADAIDASHSARGSRADIRHHLEINQTRRSECKHRA